MNLKQFNIIFNKNTLPIKSQLLDPCDIEKDIRFL